MPKPVIDTQEPEPTDSNDFSGVFNALRKGEDVPPETEEQPAAQPTEPPAPVEDPTPPNDPPAEPPPAEPPAEPELTPEEQAAADHKARSAEGRALKAQRELEERQAESKRLDDELAEKRRLVAEAAAPPEPPPAADPPESGLTDTGFGEQFPEFAGDIDAHIAKQLAAVQTDNSLQGTVEQQQQQIATLQSQLSQNAIETVHGQNWHTEFVASGLVDAYVAEQSEYAQPELKRIIRSGTAGEVTKLLSNAKAASPAPVTTESPPPDPAPAPPAQVGRRSGRSTPAAAPPDPAVAQSDFQGTFAELEKKRLAEREKRLAND